MDQIAMNSPARRNYRLLACVNRQQVAARCIPDDCSIGAYERNAPVTGGGDNEAVRRVGVKAPWQAYAVHGYCRFDR